MEFVDLLLRNIDAMYVSPFPRTIQTAYYVFEKYPNINVHIDNRIREIFYGKYSHQKNNSELDETRQKLLIDNLSVVQMFITTAEVSHINIFNKNNTTIFRIEKGQVINIENGGN